LNKQIPINDDPVDAVDLFPLRVHRGSSQPTFDTDPLVAGAARKNAR